MRYKYNNNKEIVNNPLDIIILRICLLLSASIILMIIGANMSDIYRTQVEYLNGEIDTIYFNTKPSLYKNNLGTFTKPYKCKNVLQFKIIEVIPKVVTTSSKQVSFNGRTDINIKK